MYSGEWYTDTTQDKENRITDQAKKGIFERIEANDDGWLIDLILSMIKNLTKPD